MANNASLGRAVLELSTDSSKFFKDLDSAEGGAKKLELSFRQVGDGLSSVFGTITGGVASGKLLADAFESLAGVAKEAVLALPELVKSTMDLGEELLTTSLRTGISVETLSKLRFVAAQTGTDMAALTGAIFKMEAQLGAVGDESKKVQAAVKELGLNMRDLKNAKPEDAFVQILDKMRTLNSSDFAGVGVAIFGKGFKEIAQVARENVGEIIAEAERLGLVMTTDTAAAAKAAGDSIKAFEFQLEALGNRIGAAFLPAIIGLTHDLQDGLKTAVDESVGSFEQLGGSGGILPLVSQAMGSGSGAIAAQTELYYRLRDGLITLIRSGLEPLVSATGFVLQEYNAAIVVFGDVAQVIDGVALAFEGAALGVAHLLNIASFGKAFNDDIIRIKGNVDALIDRIAERGKAIQQSKKAEQDWATWAQQTNAAIETGLRKVAAGHVDIAAIIKQVADLSRTAAGQIGTSFDNAADSVEKKFGKKVEELADKLRLADLSGAPLAAIVKELGEEASKIANEAALIPGAFEKLPPLIKQVGAAWDAAEWEKTQQKMVLATKKFGEEVRKELEKMMKATSDALAGVFTTQQEFLNKTAALVQTPTEKIAADREAELEKFVEKFGAPPPGMEARWQEAADAINGFFDAELNLDTDAKIQAAIKSENQARIDGAQRAQQAIRDEAAGLKELANAFVQLGQVAHGTLADLVSGLGQVIVLLANTSTHVDRFGNDVKGRFGLLSTVFDKNATSTARAAAGVTAAAVAYQNFSSILDENAQSASRASNALHGAVAGAEAGAVAGPYGAVAGAIIGGIIGAFQKPEWAKIGDDIGRDLGVRISEGTAKGIEASETVVRDALIKQLENSANAADQARAKLAKKPLGSKAIDTRPAAEELNLSQIINDAGGLNSKNLDEFTHKLRDVFSMLETGHITLGLATKVLDDNWKAFVAAGTDGEGRLSAGLKELIRLNAQFGTQSKEIAAYLKGQGAAAETGFAGAADALLGPYVAFHDEIQKNRDAVAALEAEGKKGTDDWKKAVDQLTQSQALGNQQLGNAKQELDDLGTIALASFSAAVAAGTPFYEALAQVAPQLSQIFDAYKDLGIAIEDDGLKELALQAKLVQTNKALLQGPEAIGKAMVALDNMGLLDAKTFQSMERTAMAMYTRIQGEVVKVGGSTRDALLPMQDYLHKAAAEAELLGIPLDDNTQMLIDQSKELGIWKEAGKSAAQKQEEAIDKLTKAIQDLTDKLNGIPDVNFSVTGTVNWKVGDPLPSAPGAKNTAPEDQTRLDPNLTYGDYYSNYWAPDRDYVLGLAKARGFATGTRGLVDFGPGTMAMLHGKEAVLTEQGFTGIQRALGELISRPAAGDGPINVTTTVHAQLRTSRGAILAEETFTAVAHNHRGTGTEGVGTIARKSLGMSR